MLEPLTLEDLAELTETVELECKLAQGLDGKGELPKDFWATYSAFANTHGGVVVLGIHARDLSLLLARMVRDGWLVADGRARGTFYHLPGEMPPTPEQVFALASASSEHNDGRSEHNAAYDGGSSEHNASSSVHNDGSSTHSRGLRNADGCLLSEHLDAPLIDSLDELSEELLTQLNVFAEEPRERQRMAPSRMRELIRLLCSEHYITLNVLALLLNRSPTALRLHYLNSMVRNREIQLAFPSKPTHSRQAYKASTAGSSHES